MRSIALAAAIAVVLASHARATPEPGYTEDVVVTGLNLPTALAFLPDGRMLITEKGGFGGAANARLLVSSGGTASLLVGIPVCTASEMGLLGVAIDPSFASNGFIYLYRSFSPTNCGTATGRSNEVVRVTMDAGGNVNIASLVVLLTGIRTDGGNHDGGTLRIGPDNKLYVSVGDTGIGDFGPPGASTNPYAQSLAELNGKILRLNLDGSPPADNPFFGQVGVREEILAYGMRNPFRMSFDPIGGRLWVGDVGQQTWEEIDVITPGANYGWPECEGNHDVSGTCDNPAYTLPVFEYPQSGPGALGESVTGGTFAGAAFGPESGQYIFGDFISNRVYRLAVNATRDGVVGGAATIVTNAGGPADFVRGPDGAVYWTALSTGEIRRVAGDIGPGNAELLFGKKLLLREKPTDASKKRLTMLAKDQSLTIGGGNNTGDDPVTSGGGSLRVRGNGFDDTYPLPSSLWNYLGSVGANKGYKYRDRFLSAGPVKTLTVKAGKLIKVLGKGSDLGHTVASDPSPVDVVLTMAGKTYCMQFTSGVLDPGKKFLSKDSGPPAACP